MDYLNQINLCGGGGYPAFTRPPHISVQLTRSSLVTATNISVSRNKGYEYMDFTSGSDTG